MERLWAKLFTGNRPKLMKKVKQEQNKSVATKEADKKFEATTGAGAEEQKPLLEQNDEEDGDDDVFEDALSEISKEVETAEVEVSEVEESEVEESEVEQSEVEEEEVKFFVGAPDTPDDEDAYLELDEAVAVDRPMVQIRSGSIWSHSAQLHVEQELSVLTLRRLKEPMQISPRTTLLYLGQHALLVTAYFRSADSSKVPVPFTRHMAISVSYTDHVMYPTCINNGLVTATAGIMPLGRNVFRIKSACPIGAMSHVRYGQPIILQLSASATPIYLAGGTRVGLDNSCPVRLLTVLDEFCYFRFVKCIQEKGNNMEDYPVASHAAFLVQHVESNLFLTFNWHDWVATKFGLENSVELQPLEYINNRVENKHFFKVFLN